MTDDSATDAHRGTDHASARADSFLSLTALAVALLGAISVVVVVVMGLQNSTPPTAVMAVAYIAPPVAVLLMVVLWIRTIIKRRNA